MAARSKNSNLQAAIDNSVRQEVKEDIDSGSSLLFMLAGQNGSVAPWWSRRRDSQLRDLLKRSDHLSGAMYNLCTKIAAIPLHITPKDRSIRQHVILADEYTDYFRNYTEFGGGWEHFISKWVEEYHSQDNGAFVEFIADGASDTPVRGMIYSMNVLDAAQCTRTSNPEFPVIYTDKYGKRYKMHHTRVAAISQSPSPRYDMNNVGFSAVSRCITTAQNLLDIAVYKQERMGSRPSQGILITGGGLDPDDLENAMAVGSMNDDEAGLSRYSTYTVVGNKNYLDPKLEQIRLNEAPEWFDEKESTILGMAVIAMAFGVDARELFPSIDAGSSKAEAIITHIKQRGKGPGHIISVLEHMLNTKVLPDYLKAEFDFQDDSQDRQSAEIGSVRSYTRVRNIQAGVTDPRVERQLMLERGEITQAQFEELELTDGRLDTGVSVEVLFYSEDEEYKQWLGDCTPENADDKKIEIMKFLVGTRATESIRKARRAIAAIEWRFPPEPDPLDPNEKLPRDSDGDGMIYDGTSRERPISTPNRRRGRQGPSDSEAAMPDESYADNESVGRRLPKPVVNAPDETQRYQDREAGKL